MLPKRYNRKKGKRSSNQVKTVDQDKGLAIGFLVVFHDQDGPLLSSFEGGTGILDGGSTDPGSFSPTVKDETIEEPKTLAGMNPEAVRILKGD